MALDPVAVVAALGTLTAAGVAGWQGWLQKQNLRLALFERRFKVFQSTMGFLADTARSGFVEEHRPEQLLRDTVSAEFIFDADVPAFIQRVYERAHQYRDQNILINTEANSDRRAALIDQRKPLEEWLFQTAFAEGKELFRPYLITNSLDWNSDLK